MELNVEQCPLCGTELSEVKFKEIQARLLREEEDKAAALSRMESALRLQLEQQFNQDLEKQRLALEKKAKDEAEANIKQVTSELDLIAKKLKEAEAREVEIRRQSQEELAREKLAAQLQAKAEAQQQIKQATIERDALAGKLEEAQRQEAENKKETQERIERLTRAAEKQAREDAADQINELMLERDQAAEKVREAEAREAEIRKETEQEIQRHKEAAESNAKILASEQVNELVLERDQAAKQAKEAEAREAAARKQIEDAEKERSTQLANQRQSLETDKKLALLKQQSEFNRERESLQAKLHLVERQLQKKTANELGDGAEIDLYETLRESFPHDNITRVRKGQAGPDILHEVLYKGASCGRIIIDSKNHKGWQNAFVTKLRQDRIEAGAEHAILATTVFPAGKKEMYIESDVIVISPARVVHIAQLLRNAMVSMHVKGLSIEERSTKMVRLYKLITSDSYSRKLTEASKLSEEILDLDVQEMKAHENVWKKRGSLAKRVQNVLREAETDVAAVIESIGDEETPPAFEVKSAPNLSAASHA